MIKLFKKNPEGAKTIFLVSFSRRCLYTLQDMHSSPLETHPLERIYPGF